MNLNCSSCLNSLFTTLFALWKLKRLKVNNTTDKTDFIHRKGGGQGEQQQ